ncbi:hypothetical protein P4414_26985 [Bacillus thuringiensis]|nr:hypothetical protein [Bacillus thuringiensis]
MAYIGQILLKPETGWNRYDDNDKLITYEGIWTANQLSTAYNRTYHFGAVNQKYDFHL